MKRNHVAFDTILNVIAYLIYHLFLTDKVALFIVVGFIGPFHKVSHPEQIYFE